jgi:hypothetical protein
MHLGEPRRLTRDDGRDKDAKAFMKRVFGRRGSSSGAASSVAGWVSGLWSGSGHAAAAAAAGTSAGAAAAGGGDSTSPHRQHRHPQAQIDQIFAGSSSTSASK